MKSNGGEAKRLIHGMAMALVAFSALALFFISGATAATDAEELTSFGAEGASAGKLAVPQGIATDPTTGQIFTVELANGRISEFTPWGSFVKAFGWDVAPGAVNEQQEVRVRAAAGQFKLGFGADTTNDLPFNASATEVEAALNGLATVSSGGGSVSVSEVLGNSNGATPFLYILAFKGSLAGSDVAQLGAEDGTTPLSGGDPVSSVEVRTRADGTPSGSGLESCTEESGCKAGVEGDGAGQIREPWGVAVAANGDVYVRESANNRIQKFDAAGRFLLMFGGGVNETTGADVCTDEDVEVDGNVCGAGTAGTGQGEFAGGFDLALGTNGTIFVADKDRIEAFKSDGSFDSEINVPGETVSRLAISPGDGDFYVVLEGKENVRRLSSVGVEKDSCAVKSPGPLATDSSGNIYVISGNGFNEGQRVAEFDSSCDQVANLAVPEILPGNKNNVRFALTGIGTNAVGDLYVANVHQGTDSFIRAFGPPPVRFESPPLVPPSIEAQFATSVESEEALLVALINPHFWPDANYYVEYGTGKCSEGGCDKVQPVPPGELLTPKILAASVRTNGTLLQGLQAATSYHYRFVTQSGGGGPVRGRGGKVGVDGAEGTFNTFPESQPPKSCPNAAFRLGASDDLPDCRAYEMVSPIDKNNGDIKALLNSPGFSDMLSQSSSSGNKLTYSSYRSFADPQAAPYTNQYLARRNATTGWSSEALAPPQGPASSVTLNLENEYRAFAGDLCTGWLALAAEPLLDPGASEGIINIYRRDNCGDGGYEALIQGVTQNNEPPELQGTSGDGKTTILRIKDKLTTDATSGVYQLYLSSKGELHLICVLPSGLPSAGNCSGGTAPEFAGADIAATFPNRTSGVTHAMSTDGSLVYWTSSTGPSGTGKVYLRENPSESQSAVSGGVCTEAGKACTVKVSETQSSLKAQFLVASADGEKAFFAVTEGPKTGNLYLYDHQSGSSTLVAPKAMGPVGITDSGVLGASDDLSHVYFVSSEVLGTGAKVGRPNLYLNQDGTTSFIATLSDTDVFTLAQGPAIPSNVATEPVYHVARVSADGSRVAFISTEPLTGYDNSDQESGRPDSEVFTYEAGAAGPVCVSCNPSGARPQGRVVQAAGNQGALATAASIPAANYQLSTPRPLSADGSRLFFNSFDPLIARDDNGKQDVYEWEAADGAKACEEMGAELYVASASGCLSLISSGESLQDSEFLDASPSGDDVFFTTNDSLVPQDPGLFDVYDARVQGGIPVPAPGPDECRGEAACQGLPPIPPARAPLASSVPNPGNPAAKKKPCAKGKVRRSGHCVAKKHKQKGHQRKASHKRRAQR